MVVVAARHVPESRDPEAPRRINWSGAALAASGLGLLTYGLTAAGENRAAGSLVTVVVGAALLAAFVVVQRRSSHPLVPLGLFAHRQFRVANLVTLLVCAALGVLFVLLVLQLQVVGGFSPLVAGTGLLPVTALMLLLSARVGALSARIGPRPLMSAGLTVSALGLLLMLRIGSDASYRADVLPAALVLGAGLALTVAPLTATVLDSAPDRVAGAASAVNNAVARTAGLLAVAVVPAAIGLSGDDYLDPVAFDEGFRAAVVVCAVLLGLAAAVAAVAVRRVDGTTPEPVGAPRRLPVERCPHCGVSSPPSHPSDLRVFGSVARGEDGPDSDLDLMVRPPEGAGLLAISRFADELEDLLQVRVDVVPEGTLKPRVRSRVESDLVAL